jgi:hypothetical protein
VHKNWCRRFFPDPPKNFFLDQPPPPPLKVGPVAMHYDKYPHEQQQTAILETQLRYKRSNLS